MSPRPTATFFFNDTATTEIYTLSLHDALPISRGATSRRDPQSPGARAPVTKPKVRDLLERRGDLLQLEALTGDVGLDREIPAPEASSPGLVLAGYTKRFAANRIHILGETEVTYLASLEAAPRRRALETLLQFELPCVVISKGQDAPAELVELARARGVAAIRTPLKTDRQSTRLNSSHSQISYAVFCLRNNNRQPRSS